MKRVTASDARKNWFRILDEVAAGEVVSIERGGRRIVLRHEPPEDEATVPDYGAILTAVSVNDADQWGWEWSDPGADLEPLEFPPDE